MAGGIREGGRILDLQVGVLVLGKGIANGRGRDLDKLVGNKYLNRNQKLLISLLSKTIILCLYLLT